MGLGTLNTRQKPKEVTTACRVNHKPERVCTRRGARPPSSCSSHSARSRKVSKPNLPLKYVLISLFLVFQRGNRADPLGNCQNIISISNLFLGDTKGQKCSCKTSFSICTFFQGNAGNI